MRRLQTLVGWAPACQLSYARISPLCLCVGVSTSKPAVYVGVYSASYSKPRQKSPAEDGPRDERTTGAGMGKRGSARGLDTWGFGGDPGCETFSALQGFSVLGMGIPRYLVGFSGMKSFILLARAIWCRVSALGLVICTLGSSWA